MITLCTNNETLRSTLEQGLSDIGIDEMEQAAICEVSGGDIWANVFSRLDGEGLIYETGDQWRDWNGGKFSGCMPRSRFGHRCGNAHSAASYGEAMAVDDKFDTALVAELAEWKEKGCFDAQEYK